VYNDSYSFATLPGQSCYVLPIMSASEVSKAGGPRWSPLLSGFTVVLSVLFLCVIGSPLITGKQFLTGDLGEYYFPFRHFYSQCLKTGESPYWCPNVWSGVNLQGEGHMGMMHPLHPALYRFTALRTAVPIEMMIWYTVLLAGAYLLFRKWRVSGFAALAGAFVFTFGGYTLLRFVHPNGVAVLAHMPWLLLTIHALAEATTPYRVAGCCMIAALLTASQVLMGFPQFVLDSLLIESGYLLCVTDRRRRFSRAALMASTKVAAALIGAAQLLPTWGALHQSIRATPSLEFLAQGSVHPLNLLQLVNPFVLASRHFGELHLHELGIYPGLGVGLVFVWFCLSPVPAPYRRLRRLLIALAVLGFVLALGKYNLVFPLYARLPGLGLFRNPCRYYFLTSFALAGACALAIDRFLANPSLSEGRLRLLRILSACLFTLALVASAAALTAGPIRGGIFASPWNILAGASVVGVGCGLFWMALRGGATARMVFLFFVLGDVGFYHLSYLLRLYRANPAESVTLPLVPPPGPVYTSESYNQLMLAGYRLVTGYAALEKSAILARESPMLRLLAGSLANEVPGGWVLAPQPFSRVRLLSAVAQTADPARDITRIDLATTALAFEPIGVDPEATGHAVVLEDRPGQITIEAETSGRMAAALTERFDPGWTGRLDGNPISLVRVNGDFLGFPVPAGHHAIKLAFDPWELRWGIQVSLLGLALLGLYPACAYFAERRRLHAGQ
jgi:hypothetical protein